MYKYQYDISLQCDFLIKNLGFMNKDAVQAKFCEQIMWSSDCQMIVRSGLSPISAVDRTRKLLGRSFCGVTG